MREVKQMVRYWPGDIVRDSFGRMLRVLRFYITVDPDIDEEPFTVYVCGRMVGPYREEEFGERELMPGRKS